MSEVHWHVKQSRTDRRIPGWRVVDKVHRPEPDLQTHESSVTVRVGGAEGRHDRSSNPYRRTRNRDERGADDNSLPVPRRAPPHLTWDTNRFSTTETRVHVSEVEPVTALSTKTFFQKSSPRYFRVEKCVIFSRPRNSRYLEKSPDRSTNPYRRQRTFALVGNTCAAT